MQISHIIPAMVAAVWLGTFPTRAAAPAGLELTRDGQAQAVVVLPESPPVEVRHAAKELIEYVRRISGATLPVGAIPAKGPAIALRIDSQLNPLREGQHEWRGARDCCGP